MRKVLEVCERVTDNAAAIPSPASFSALRTIRPLISAATGWTLVAYGVALQGELRVTRAGRSNSTTFHFFARAMTPRSWSPPCEVVARARARAGRTLLQYWERRRNAWMILFEGVVG